MKNLIKNNLTLSKKYSHTVRYIDDLLTLNNSGFEDTINDIYPPELELKKTTDCPTTLSYLDIRISIVNGKYFTAVFDKRDNFNFTIVNFPHMTSNIPSKPAYGVYISQLIRIGRICNSFVQFKDRHYKLTEKLIKQGYWYSGLCKAFKKFSRSHTAFSQNISAVFVNTLKRGYACQPFFARISTPAENVVCWLVW